jgi:hypothetical protein
MDTHVLYYDKARCSEKTLGEAARVLTASGIEFRLANDALEFESIHLNTPCMVCNGLSEIKWYAEGYAERAQLVGQTQNKN